ncbi:hypothetical protein A2627_05220 [Candidatus Woesebacteria bacterium RIFCSPHIGHO2_01_FULL_39_28]|uniref:DOD-type homing endonuclease domain-containing protein n=1 Tax=Candidatus Woesebacteria bacterium RIFCSPHIGHO2_01_FULL_39_28 TaxID=1802496 RepID=A0A1F7Y8U8_9BACT|nr:MAG: hypothetical protein A2627_05220 [Candidatus Woesebacteria bacterium RIFCSPHIGHO2_01_FULL_39_28]
MLHDATERKSTYRIATKSNLFARFLCNEIKKFGLSAWFYKEGKNRNLWIVEFSKTLLKVVRVKTERNKIDYIRGYFDSEGGISKNLKVRYYLYFAQKNKSDLLEVKNYLEDLNISCGKLHNPSKRVDPNYWRFFVSSKSYEDFYKIIGSSHPEKKVYLRMKI